jgi:hypothetical protein
MQQCTFCRSKVFFYRVSIGSLWNALLNSYGAPWIALLLCDRFRPPIFSNQIEFDWIQAMSGIHFQSGVFIMLLDKAQLWKILRKPNIEFSCPAASAQSYMELPDRIHRFRRPHRGQLQRFVRLQLVHACLNVSNTCRTDLCNWVFSAGLSPSQLSTRNVNVLYGGSCSIVHKRRFSSE